MNIQLLKALLPILLTLLAGCSEPPKADKAKEPEKPPAPVTGRQAFQSMYPTARTWALDAQPLQLRSVDIQEVKSEKGRSGAWQGTFVSPAKGKARSYTFSVAEAAGNLHRGVFAGPEESWAGPRGQSMPFDIVAIKTDSDAAYDLAVEHSADYVKKFPDKPVSFLLEQTRRFPDLAWRVIYGESVSTSDYSVFVDATTGKFLEKVH